jgi:hypothetical protein
MLARWSSGIGLFLSLALSACGGQPAADSPADMPAEATDRAGATIAAPASAPTMADAAADGLPTSASTEGSNAAPAPAAKTAMEASDPATVAFGQGRPQFVDVFAFW